MLIQAASRGHIDIVREFVAKGSNVKFIQIALMTAILAGCASLYVHMAVPNGSIRARSSSMPARPYMARLGVLRRLICVPDGLEISAQRSRKLLH